MGFNWVGFIFWFLIGTSVILFIWGLWEKSWKILLSSGVALTLPSLYFLGAENWFKILALLPVIVFILAAYYYAMPKRN